MGIEIVFGLILPIAALCLIVSTALWFRVAKMDWSGEIGLFKLYVPLAVGFSVSMAGLAILTYIQCYTDFTYLVQEGYYAEMYREIYLPRRVIGQAVVQLVFVLPAISFVVVPLTTWLIRRDRLTLKGIGLSVILGWFALSLLGWVFAPHYSFPSFLVSSAVPVLLYGLAIPLAAWWLLPSKSQGYQPPKKLHG